MIVPILCLAGAVFADMLECGVNEVVNVTGGNRDVVVVILFDGADAVEGFVALN